MKVISWNMNYWQQKSTFELAWDFLVNVVNPDIALLQETVVPESYKNQTVFMASKTCKAADSIKWGTCIYISNRLLNKCSLINVAEQYVNMENDNGKQVFAEVKLNKGGTLTLCSLHANTSPDGIYSIKNHIEHMFNEKVMNPVDKKMIIGGDFNADTKMDNGFFIETFNRISLDYHECIPEYTQTYFGENMFEQNHYQDDHIFVSNDLSESIQETFTWNYGKVKKFSDHTILEVELKL